MAWKELKTARTRALSPSSKGQDRNDKQSTNEKDAEKRLMEKA